MPKQKERRINTYFGRTVEENELWNFLNEHPDPDNLGISHWLKYYARVGMLGIEKTVNQPAPGVAKKRAKKDGVVTGHNMKAENMPNTENLPKRESISEVDISIPDIDSIITEVDPKEKLEQSFNKFLTEEEDEEILELVKQHESSEQSEGEETV